MTLPALARGLNIECGCFGTVGGKHVGLVNLALDAMLLFLAALLARRSKNRPVHDIFSGTGQAPRWRPRTVPSRQTSTEVLQPSMNRR